MQECWFFTCCLSCTLGSSSKCSQFKPFLYIGIKLVDVHLNWFNWLHFLILEGGLLIILINCMIFVSPFLDWEFKLRTWKYSYLQKKLQGHTSMHDMALRLTHYFYLLMKKPLNGESCILILSSNLGLLTFLYWSLRMILRILLLGIYVSVDFGYYCADWYSLCDHIRYVPCEDIFNLGISIAAWDFIVESKLEMMYISFTEGIRLSLINFHNSQLLLCCHRTKKSLVLFVPND